MLLYVCNAIIQEANMEPLCFFSLAAIKHALRMEQDWAVKMHTKLLWWWQDRLIQG